MSSFCQLKHRDTEGTEFFCLETDGDKQCGWIMDEHKETKARRKIGEKNKIFVPSFLCV